MAQAPKSGPEGFCASGASGESGAGCRRLTDLSGDTSPSPPPRASAQAAGRYKGALGPAQLSTHPAAPPAVLAG